MSKCGSSAGDTIGPRMGWLYDWGRLSAPRVHGILGRRPSCQHRPAGGSHHIGREPAAHQPRANAVQHLFVARQGPCGVQAFGKARRGGQLSLLIQSLERFCDPGPIDASGRELARQRPRSAHPAPPPHEAPGEGAIVHVAELGQPAEGSLHVYRVVAPPVELLAQLEARMSTPRQQPQAAVEGRPRRRGLRPGASRTPPFHLGSEP